MKYLHMAFSGLLTGAAGLALAADEGALAPRQIEIPRHRVGDFVVQGTIAPAWVVPAAPAGGGKAPMAAVPPTVQRVSAQVPAADAAAPPVPARMGSRQWRDRIAALETEIEARRRELAQARDSLITAVADEARQAQEQYAAAQRHAEDMRLQAERAAALAQASRPAPPAPEAATTPVPKPPELVFTLRESDRTMAAAFTRWGEEAKYHVLWEEREDPPVPFEDTYAMPLPDAVHRVVTALNMAGHRLLMCEYSNRVVRVVPRDATCRVHRNIQTNLADGVAK